MWEQPKGFRPASVAVLLTYDGGQWWTLIIRRPAWMREHPAQLGFPGGKQDPGDRTLWVTAKRETAEEVGVAIAHSQCIGCLEPVAIAVTRYWVWPWLVGLSRKLTPDPNPREVEEAYWVSLSAVWEASRTGPHGFCYQGDFGTIWGASARIIQQLQPHHEVRIEDHGGDDSPVMHT